MGFRRENLDVAPAEGADAAADGFGDGLFGSETPRQVFGEAGAGEAAGFQIVTLGLTEQAVKKAVATARQDRCEPGYADHVKADTGDAAHCDRLPP